MQNQRQLITSKTDNFGVYLKKLWRYKSLVWVFALRDLKVKYAQTLLGLSWSILQPLTGIIIYSYFFGYLLNWKADSLPFPVYVLSGLIGWNFFSYIVYQGSSSIQESGNTIKKIYFPKSILPFSKVMIGLVELLLSLLLLIPLLLIYNVSISWQIIFFPLAIIYTMLCGLLLVFWVAIFAYKKRDLFHLLPYVVTFGIWLTPVFFTQQIIPQKMSFVMDINPMASSINFWRWILFDYGEFNLMWIVSFAVVFVLCVAGMYFYHREEGEFSDFV
jgi:lipopolysaccharide transport system permease protein